MKDPSICMMPFQFSYRIEFIGQRYCQRIYRIIIQFNKKFLRKALNSIFNITTSYPSHHEQFYWKRTRRHETMRRRLIFLKYLNIRVAGRFLQLLKQIKRQKTKIYSFYLVYMCFSFYYLCVSVLRCIWKLYLNKDSLNMSS